MARLLDFHKDDIYANLTKKQARFVRAYVALGGTNASEAARQAGYAPDSASVTGSQLLRNSRVLDAIKKEVEFSLRGSVMTAVETLKQAASEDGGAPWPTRLAAAKELLDRGGMMLVKQTEHKVVMEDHRSDKELLEELRRLAGEDEMIGRAYNRFIKENNIVDAEYVEVSPARIAAPDQETDDDEPMQEPCQEPEQEDEIDWLNLVV